MITASRELTARSGVKFEIGLKKKHSPGVEPGLYDSAVQYSPKKESANVRTRTQDLSIKAYHVAHSTKVAESDVTIDCSIN